MRHSYFRRTFAILLVLVTCLSTIAFPRKAEAISKNAKVYVSGMSLTLYQKQSTSSKKTTVYTGTELTYLGKGTTSGYYKVKYSGNTRYIKSSKDIGTLVTTDKAALLAGTNYRKLKEKTNLLKTPSASAGKVVSLAKGTYVAVVASDSTWSCVCTSAGKIGYVRSKLLTTETRYVKAISLALYKSCSTSASKVTVYTGTAVTYGGKASTSGYYKVIYDKTIRYIKSTDIDQLLATKKADVTTGTLSKVVNKGAAIRKTPASSATSLQKVVKGDLVSVITSNSTWSYVVSSTGKRGYIYTSCLSDDIRYIKKVSQKLYKTQNTDSSVTVYAGTPVTFIGPGTVDGYYKVKYNGNIRYLKTTAPGNLLTSDQAAWESAATYSATAADVTLRAKPLASAASVAELSRRTGVMVICSNSTWSYVSTADGKYGFLKNADLTEDNRYLLRISAKLYKTESTSADYTTVYTETALTYCGPGSKTNYYKVKLAGETRYLYTALSIDEVLGYDLADFYAGGKTVALQKKINLRSTPSTESNDNILTRLSVGDEFTVYTEIKEGSWVYGAAASGKKGYYFLESSSAFSDLGKPALGSAKNGLCGITLTWSAVSSATGYTVYRHMGDGAWTAVAEIGSGSTTTWLDKTLNNGAKAYYSVQAKQTSGSVTYVSSYDRTGVSATRTFLLSAPVATASNEKEGIRISWTKVTDADKYVVLRSLGGSRWEKIATTSNAYYLDKNNEDGTACSYRIACWNTTESVQTSEYCELTSRRLDAPGSYFLRQTGTSVYLAWGGWSGADSYEIYRSADGTNWSRIATTGDPIYTDSGLTVGKTYYYSVRLLQDGVKGYLDKTASTGKAITLVDQSGLSFINLISQKLKTEASNNAEYITVTYGTPVKKNGKDEVKTTGTYIGVTYNSKDYYIWQGKDDPEALTDHLKTYTEGTSVQLRAIARGLSTYVLPTGYKQGDSTGVMQNDGKYYFDCSGLMSYILKTTMRAFVPTYTFYSTTERMLNEKAVFSQGFSNEGTIVTLYNKLAKSGPSLANALSNLQPGDIFLLDTDDDGETAPTHAAMYLGNGDYIHCTTYLDKSLNGVFLAPLDQKAQANIVAIRRFIPASLKGIGETRYGKYNTTNYVYATLDMEKSGDSPIDTLPKGTAVTLLYTNNGNWTNTDGKWTETNNGKGYVSYGDGKYGFVYLSTFVKEKP